MEEILENNLQFIIKPRCWGKTIEMKRKKINIVCSGRSVEHCRNCIRLESGEACYDYRGSVALTGELFK